MTLHTHSCPVSIEVHASHPVPRSVEKRVLWALCRRTHMHETAITKFAGTAVLWPSRQLGLNTDAEPFDFQPTWGYQFSVRMGQINYCVHTNAEPDNLEVRIHQCAGNILGSLENYTGYVCRDRPPPLSKKECPLRGRLEACSFVVRQLEHEQLLKFGPLICVASYETEWHPSQLGLDGSQPIHGYQITVRADGLLFCVHAVELKPGWHFHLHEAPSGFGTACAACDSHSH